MKELLKNKWAWAVFILVVINIATIGAMWCSMCGRGGKMECHRGEMFHHGGHGHAHGHGPGKGAHRGEDFLSKELNLTEEQKTRFEALRKEHFAKMKVNGDSMQALKKEMIKSLGKTEAEINSILQKIGAQEIRIQKELFDHFNKMYAICTDSQKVQLKEKLENIMGHHGPGFPPRGGEKCGVNHCEHPGAGPKSCCSMHGDSAKTH